MNRSVSMLTSVVLVCAAAAVQGCASPGGGRLRRPTPKSVIRHVACIYDQKPWFSVDKAGDLDPEGIRYRVFLDPGTGRGVLRDGMLHIEMYQIDFTPDGTTRKLVSDWIYPTSDFAPVRSNLLGMGYLVRLRWASKDIAGHEVEIVTRFEDFDGNVIAGAGTKRLRVPKSGQ